VFRVTVARTMAGSRRKLLPAPVLLIPYRVGVGGRTENSSARRLPPYIDISSIREYVVACVTARSRLDGIIAGCIINAIIACVSGGMVVKEGGSVCNTTNKRNNTSNGGMNGISNVVVIVISAAEGAGRDEGETY
jgi:Na+/H+ antiporter NhaC